MRLRWLGPIVLAGLAVVVLPATPAAAHPLGNFSVNSYVGLTIHPDRVDATAIVDVAEIPTLQDRPAVDHDGDGQVTPAEQVTYAGQTCATVADQVELTRAGNRLLWTVVRSSYGYSPGAAGLEVSRLTCDLTTATTVDGPTSIAVTNRYLADRVGWRELTAVGSEVRLVDPPVPAESVSHQLRDYPKDLLSSTLDERSAVLRVEPGTGTVGGAAVGVGPDGDPVTRALAALDRRLAELVGGDHLTVGVGLLAVLVAALLGAGHAALPGHGKTVLAAYLAGKRGRPRDALTVAATVTLTHTGGVLALGLALTAGAAVAGEQILGWLGVVSGTVVVAVGIGMVLGLRRRTSPDHAHAHPHSHSHRHGHGHGHGSAHSHGTRHTLGLAHAHSSAHDHGSAREHGAGHSHGSAHSNGPARGGRGLRGRSAGGDHGHRHDGGDDHSGQSRWRRRWGLAGIGLAGGLVPSPSALVVMLGAIGLGRTGFGIVLVLVYGAGMAATLTGAGLLLLALQRRLARTGRAATGTRLQRLAGRIGAATPAVTAGLVLVVGIGLALRSAAGVI